MSIKIININQTTLKKELFMPIAARITDLIGKTPLVKINRLNNGGKGHNLVNAHSRCIEQLSPPRVPEDVLLQAHFIQ